MMNVPINYMAVIVAAIAIFILGSLWYGPIFGRNWREMMGMRREEMGQGSMVGPIIISLIGAYIMALIFDYAIIFSNFYLDKSGVGAALRVGLLVWLGFVVPITIRRVLWEKQSLMLWLFNETYNLFILLVLGFVLAMWQ